MSKATYDRGVVIGFAAYCARNPNTGLPLNDLFKVYLRVQSQPAGDMLHDKEKHMQEIYKVAAAVNGLQYDEVLSPRKYGKIPRARQQTAYVCLQCGYDEHEIAGALAWQRSSVYHRCWAAEKFASVESDYRETLNVILRKFDKDEFIA